MALMKFNNIPHNLISKCVTKHLCKCGSRMPLMEGKRLRFGCISIENSFVGPSAGNITLCENMRGKLVEW